MSADSPPPAPAVYERARAAARAALKEEPELIGPGYLVLRRMVDAAVDSAWIEVSSAAAERDKLVEAIGQLVSLPPARIAEIYSVTYTGQERP